MNIKKTLRLCLAAAVSAAAASWAAPAAQPMPGYLESVYVEETAEAGEIKMFSAGSTCPAGWSPYAAARGRFPLGLTTGGTVRGTLGAAYGDSDGPVRRGGTAQVVSFSGTAQGGSYSGTAAGGSFSGSSTSLSGTFSGNSITPRITVSLSGLSASFSGNSVRPSAAFRGTSRTFRIGYRGDITSLTVNNHSHSIGVLQRGGGGRGADGTVCTTASPDCTAQVTISTAFNVNRTNPPGPTVTPRASVSVGRFTPSGTVSMVTIIPQGSVSISGSASGTMSRFTPSGSVNMRAFTVSGTIGPRTYSGSFGARAASGSASIPNQAEPAPAAQVLFCIAEVA